MQYNGFRWDKFVARIVSDRIPRDIRLIEVVFGLGFASSNTTSTNRISRGIRSLTIRVTNIILYFPYLINRDGLSTITIYHHLVTGGN